MSEFKNGSLSDIAHVRSADEEFVPNLKMRTKIVKPITNVEFVTELMEYGIHGALRQVFIVEALRFYSEIISKSVPSEQSQNTFINPQAWKEIAIDINQKLESKYGDPNTTDGG